MSPRPPPRPAKPDPRRDAERGLSARHVAVQALTGVLERRLQLEEAFLRAERGVEMADRDRGLARGIVVVALRRLGTLRNILARRLAKGLPAHAGPFEAIVLTATAQLLYLEVPDHAAVDCAIDLCRRDRLAVHYASLANAVLRRIAREKAEILAEDRDPLIDTPIWLAERWRNRWGEADALAIARANASEAALDLTVKSDPEGWAARLDGRVMPTGTVRLITRQPVQALEGYEAGEWWVQDAAASIPARLLAVKPGERVLDLCAAPGGKTAQLALAGGAVVAVDRSGPRLQRLRENLARLRLTAEVVEMDALIYPGPPADAILVDAPCSSTGTIRRHPDVAWTKRIEDIEAFAALQKRLLDKAVALVKPGGRIVFATCSLEPEEGEDQVEGLLGRHDDLRLSPILPEEAPGLGHAIHERGWLRILPSNWPNDTERLAGLDGFFAARLIRGG